MPLGGGSLGLRVWQKNATDLIDDTQVGVTLLHQDINYELGRLSSESVFYQLPLERNGRFYTSVTHTVSLNSGCETQLLAPCFGAPTGYTPADHDQRWDVTSGILLNDRHDGWFAFDGEYGSGLSSASCPDGTPGHCKRTPHVTFDAEKGIGIGQNTALTFRIRNLLNDRYFVTLANAQGDHYAPAAHVSTSAYGSVDERFSERPTGTVPRERLVPCMSGLHRRARMPCDAAWQSGRCFCALVRTLRRRAAETLDNDAFSPKR